MLNLLLKNEDGVFDNIVSRMFFNELDSSFVV